jgi:hypothetical protein
VNSPPPHCLCVNCSLGSTACFLVEGEVCSVRSSAGEEGAVFGGAGEGRMGMSSVVCFYIGFEVGVYVGRGVAFCLWYKYVWPRPCAYKHVSM